jgi:hypothetical protein
MSGDDTLNEIHIHMGETRKGIANLESAVSGVQRELRSLNQGTVKRLECTERHVIVARSVNALDSKLDGIKGDVLAIRRQTGKEHAVITPEMLRRPTKGIKYWISIGVGIASLFGFLGGLLWGVISIGRYIEKVDTIARKAQVQSSKFRKEIKEVAKARPRIVYVKVPVVSDAGPEKKPRRRYRRRPASRRTTGASSGSRPPGPP